MGMFNHLKHSLIVFLTRNYRSRAENHVEYDVQQPGSVWQVIVERNKKTGRWIMGMRKGKQWKAEREW